MIMASDFRTVIYNAVRYGDAGYAVQGQQAVETAVTHGPPLRPLPRLHCADRLSAKQVASMVRWLSTLANRSEAWSLRETCAEIERRASAACICALARTSVADKELR